MNTNSHTYSLINLIKITSCNSKPLNNRWQHYIFKSHSINHQCKRVHTKRGCHVPYTQCALYWQTAEPPVVRVHKPANQISITWFRMQNWRVHCAHMHTQHREQKYPCLQHNYNARKLTNSHIHIVCARSACAIKSVLSAWFVWNNINNNVESYDSVVVVCLWPITDGMFSDRFRISRACMRCVFAIRYNYIRGLASYV